MDTIDMFWWLIISGMQDTLVSLWVSAQISSLMCLWKLTVAACLWSVKICKSSQSQLSSFHFSECLVTEPGLVFSVRQLLRWGRLHVCHSLPSCCVGSTPGILAFPKNGYFQLPLTNEQYLKWVKEVSPRFLLTELLADRRFKAKSWCKGRGIKTIRN